MYNINLFDTTVALPIIGQRYAKTESEMKIKKKKKQRMDNIPVKSI